MLASKLSSSVGTNSVSANYIEDVFSTYLYTGNGSSQTITNGIDLAGKGGLVWVKNRTHAGTWHDLQDTERGPKYSIFSNTTNAAVFQDVYGVQSFNSDGFSVGSGADFNESTYPIASWTFRKQPKFFDVVTYTGNGASSWPGQTINHSLGSDPGFIIVKNTSSSGDWFCYHRSASGDLLLNSTAAQDNARYNITYADSTSFGVKSVSNLNGSTYVAYVFAHNAGGFGLTGTDNVISCGSYTGNGSTTNGPTITLGYEPQWLLIKRATGGTGSWLLIDVMRNMTGSSSNTLYPNLSDAENANDAVYAIQPLATGFQIKGNPVGTAINTNGSEYIYIAIRRGPMKVPTSGTSVFATQATRDNGTSGGNSFTAGFPVDLMIQLSRAGSAHGFQDRLRGFTQVLESTNTNAESGPSSFKGDRMTGVYGVAANANWGAELFRRAPSFFDEVCYTGTGVDRNITHNLGVAPELIIVKARSGSINQNWNVCFANTGANNLVLNDGREAFVDSTRFPTSGGVFFSTYFKVGTANGTNASGYTYVAYLFATCAGVSKVGSYTGTGATQTISCGFTGGARFVLIKRTDLNSGTGTAGDWYVWDTARGMVSGTDPYLLLDSTAAEVNTNSVYTTTGGFQIVSTAADINASGSNYIYLAIA